MEILKYINEINKRYRIICHYTITAYGKDVEPNVPNIDDSIDTLIKLSSIVGKEKVIWRYDPLLLTKKYTVQVLIDTFEYIASKVYNHISFALFSFVEMYKKLEFNMPEIIQFAEEDKKRKDQIEIRNNAESSLYQIEKSLKDFGDKVDPKDKTDIEDKLSALRASLEGDDLEKVKQLQEELTQAFYALSTKMYQQASPQGEEVNNTQDNQSQQTYESTDYKVEDEK